LREKDLHFILACFDLGWHGLCYAPFVFTVLQQAKRKGSGRQHETASDQAAKRLLVFWMD